jgi:hypothetical protein
MSSSGLSKARLAQLHNVMARYVERGHVPGLVALVSRRGETHVEALGMKTLAAATRSCAKRSSASLETEQSTAVGAMILIEEPRRCDRLGRQLRLGRTAAWPLPGVRTRARNMITILLPQAAWTSPVPPRVSRDSWTAAYQAIDD